MEREGPRELLLWLLVVLGAEGALLPFPTPL